MDSIFGIGAPELFVILLLAGLLMGPRQIRRVARLLGLWTARAQRYYRSFVTQLNEEIDTLEAEDVREAFREVQTLGRQMDSIGRDIRGAPGALMGGVQTAGTETRQTLRETMQELAAAPPPVEAAENTIQPPRPLEVADDPAA